MGMPQNIFILLILVVLVNQKKYASVSDDTKIINDCWYDNKMLQMASNAEGIKSEDEV